MTPPPLFALLSTTLATYPSPAGSETGGAALLLVLLAAFVWGGIESARQRKRQRDRERDGL